MPRTAFLLALLLVVPAVASAEEAFYLRPGQKVVFLGDSNTFAGRFIAYLDAYLVTRFPDERFELINLGLPSETVSGLSEPDHPFPRPDVHERLERVLTRLKPDVVVACYGMNDGIYYPFGEERFAKYQEGIQKLHDRVTKSRAKFVLMTPAPFDPLPVKDKLLPASAAKFSWLRPYEDYDTVLARYSTWLRTWQEKGIVVADAHGALHRYLTAIRKSEPAYRVSGDGIHPDASGHWIIAEELLLAWKAPTEADAVEIDVATGKVIRGQVRDLEVKPDQIRFTWTSRLPLASDPKWHRALVATQQFGERLNRYRLTVRGATAARYDLWEGKRKLGTVTRAQLTAGVDLLTFPELSSNRRSAELWKLVEERQRLLGLAWLTEIGHQRPQTPVGLPLAEAQQKAAALETRIRELARPATMWLRLEAVE